MHVLLGRVGRIAALSAFILGTAVSSTSAQIELAYPVHGTLVGETDAGLATVRLDAVPQTQAAVTKRYKLRGTKRLAAGTHIDALEEGDTLTEVTASDGYMAGIPDSRVLATLNQGDALPDMRVVDQTGTVRDLSRAWLGKSIVLSFVFTRCADAQVCPAISGKFAYLQDRLNPAKTHLIEVTVDPQFDSPKVLASYAKRYGAIPEQWSIVTGEQNQIGYLINRFGLSNLENRPGNFEHDDILAIISPEGKIQQIIPTVGWAPDDVVASVLHEQGNETNPLRRIELAAIAGVISACGGSTTTGQVVLDSTVFVLGVLFFGGILYLFGRRIWKRQ
jgi:protein SCO1/2